VQFTRFASVDVKTDDSTAGAGPQTAPAVLFCSPSGADGGWVDISYLRNLSADAGIEGDLTRSWGVRSAHLETFMNLTWDRVRQYNVLVLYGEPQGIVGSLYDNVTQMPAGVNEAWVATVLRFLAAGGGVFIFPTEVNREIQQFPTLTGAFGARRRR
jgi:hypothetical protein